MEEKVHVLLVDDEKMIRSVADEMIQALGYNVLTAANGQTAIETYKAEKDRIGLVVLDLIMPGMGGGDVFDRLKVINPEVKVLLSSGYSIDGQAAAIMKRGCQGFIQKPFNIQELSQKISQIMAADASN
jgi:CheY-like chemotaxis protein